MCKYDKGLDKKYDSLSNSIKKASLEYMLENKKERKETRNLLLEIIRDDKLDLMKEIEPYLISFYKTS